MTSLAASLAAEPGVAPGADPAARPTRLPALRQDLALHRGADTAEGAPTWTLHDPACNRFYQLSWPAFELLSRWNCGSAEAALDAVNRETTLRLLPGDIESLLRMLSLNHLLRATHADDTRRLAAEAAGQRLGLFQWLLKNYLFFRVPLLRPMAFLERAAPWLRWVFHPAFWFAVVVLAGVGLALVARRWDEFTHTFVSYADVQGALAIAAALGAAKLLHELGHAFTAQRFGCRVPTMGVAFLVMLPVLYTDTNEAWKLPSRRQRLLIGVSGMATEVVLAVVATLAWSLLPASPEFGPLRSGAFLLATTTWLVTIAINASPFMRFDGYFLMSDALNLPNLHERAFALGRWWLRERLFGLGMPVPEAHPLPRRRLLIAFAFGTWVYRLVLFLGIALLVYHLFFKALGLLLFVVEMGWFIARPIVREAGVWWRLRPRMRWNLATRRSALAVALLLVVLIWPWQHRVRAPAVLAALQAQPVHAPYAGWVDGPMPHIGQTVRRGESVLTLRSPDLAQRLALAQAQEQRLQWQLSQQPFDPRLMQAGPALRKHWEAAAEEVAGLERERQRLALTAPFEGRVADVADDITPGSWIAAGAKLMHVVGLQGSKVEAFVDEDALRLLRRAGHAVFIPDTPEQSPVVCRGVRVDPVQLATLDLPGVASPNGGGIPAKRANDGSLMPLQPTFRVRLDDCDLAAAPALELAGTALIDGDGESLLWRALRWAGALWGREAPL